MADNINVTPGTGATVAADEVGGALYQRVKIAHGADGTATDTSTAAPLPVLASGTVAVSGTPAVSVGAGTVDVNFGTVTVTAIGGIVDVTSTQGLTVLGVAKGFTAARSPTVSLAGDDHNAFDASLYDANGNRLDYPVDGLNNPSTGVTAMGYDSGNAVARHMRVSAQGYLQAEVLAGTVEVGGTAAVSVSAGTVSVDAGTINVVDAVTSITNPVAATQSGAWNVGGTVNAAQSGAWSVGLTGGTVNVAGGTIGATQSGAWSVGLTGGTVVVQDGGSSITVDATSLPLPTGAATSANQSTEIGHLATLAGAVSGTEVQVDVLTLPAVTVSAGTVSTVGAVTSITNPVNAAQSGAWSVGLTGGTVNVAGGTIGATQSGAWNVGGTIASITSPVNAAQSGAWNVGGTVNAVQSGAWNVGGTVTASPAAATMLWASGTAAAAGTAAMVAAAGSGTALVVSAFMVQNESTTANTVQVNFGTATTWRGLLQNQGDGFSFVLPVGREWNVGDNTALNLVLSASAAVGYSVAYYKA